MAQDDFGDTLVLTEVAPRELPPRSATVLVVDDDAALRKLLRKRLQTAGYDVIEASDGKAAAGAAAACRVDAVLLDVMMPDVDGWGVLGMLRDDAHTAEAKVVLMSTDPHLLADLERVDVGADAYFVKGRNSALVIDAVDRVLARRFGVLDAMPNGTWGALSDVGVSSLLARACETKLRGVLTVDDAATTWTITFDDGVIASASAGSAGFVLADRDALLSLLAGGDAPYAFDPLVEPPPRTFGIAWSRIASELFDELNAQRRRTRTYLLSMADRLSFDGPRLQCWTTHCERRAPALTEALAQGAKPTQLLAGEGASPLDVDRLLEDLWRRGVIRAPTVVGRSRADDREPCDGAAHAPARRRGVDEGRADR